MYALAISANEPRNDQNIRIFSIPWCDFGTSTKRKTVEKPVRKPYKTSGIPIIGSAFLQIGRQKDQKTSMIFTLASCVLGTFAKRENQWLDKLLQQLKIPFAKPNKNLMNSSHFEHIFAIRPRKSSKWGPVPPWRKVFPTKAPDPGPRLYIYIYIYIYIY